MKFAILIILFFVSMPGLAQETCTLKIYDIEITASGKTTNQAFENAATQCFDQLNSRRANLTESQKLALIELCVNQRCR